MTNATNNPPVGNSLGDTFLRERAILRNVTADTILWYQIAFKRFHELFPGVEVPTSPQLKQFVMRLRERGIKPITVNTYVTAMNAYCRWLFENRHATERVRIGKIPKVVKTALLEVIEQRLIRHVARGFRGRIRRRRGTREQRGEKQSEGEGLFHDGGGTGASHPSRTYIRS